MIIDCKGQWKDALLYFLDMKTAQEMRRLKLSIRKMDWRTEKVYIEIIDEERVEDYLKSLSSISDLGTMCSPREADSVNK